mgnify:CR=1 FL=1
MNDIKIFENPSFGTIRTVSRNGEPWFVAADVCRALEIVNNRDALSRLDADEKGVGSTDTPGGNQDMTIVNEPGLYALVLGSRKPEARAFKRWITHEVIPDIRKHGMYATDNTVERMLDNPDAMIALLERYRDEKAQRVALEAKAEKDAPKVLFADSVASSNQSILVGHLAKMMRQNGFEVGQNRLFEILRRDGFLCASGDRRNMPSQRSMEAGLMEIKERSINNPDGTIRLTITPMVTGKGQVYFVNRYLGKVQ